jgi:hypothetical protein
LAPHEPYLTQGLTSNPRAQRFIFSALMISDALPRIHENYLISPCSVRYRTGIRASRFILGCALMFVGSMTDVKGNDGSKGLLYLLFEHDASFSPLPCRYYRDQKQRLGRDFPNFHCLSFEASISRAGPLFSFHNREFGLHRQVFY